MSHGLLPDPMVGLAGQVGPEGGAGLCQVSNEPEVHFPEYVGAFGSISQDVDKLLEGRGVGRRELESGEEVEWLTESAAVVETAGHRGQVLEPGGFVMRPFLEDLSPLVLW